MPADPSAPRPVLYWFRRDLRLADNDALHAAMEAGPVIPVFVDSPPGPLRAPGAAARWWLHHALESLGRDLRSKGSRLVLRRGDPQEALVALAEETGACALMFTRLHEPGEAEVIAALERAGRRDGFEVRGVAANLLMEPQGLATKSGGVFQVFTPFWRALRSAYAPPRRRPAPQHVQGPPHWPSSEALNAVYPRPQAPDWAAGFTYRPGEAHAREALEAFVGDRLRTYDQDRNRPQPSGASGLSPYLHWGELSVADAWRAAAAAEARARAPAAQVEAFQRELAWRDFNHHLLAERPDLLSRSFKEPFDAFPWRSDADGLKAWRKGLTGFPFVDAGMRQLWVSGVMHNRVRLVAASFLIKDLLIDWREGEAWFWDTLVDADYANNVLNWQWVAGAGADASPFFRVFNPVAQGRRFDPDGAYVRRWIPELARLPDAFIHAPFEAPSDVLAQAGVTLGSSYPRPILDHDHARRRALDALAAMKDAS